MLGWYVVFFVLSAVADVATVVWHRHRERGNIATTALLSALLEALTWLPIWFALEWSDAGIAVASVLGAVAGTMVGLYSARVRAPQSSSLL